MHARRLFPLSGVWLAGILLLLGWAGTARGAENVYVALMEKYGLQPGMKITKENAQLIKDLVPEAFYRRVVNGDYAPIIGRFEPTDALTKVFTEEYYQACERNAGKYDVDADGGIIDKETEKRPWPMPFGLPFPKIDFKNEDPKKMGAKIEWNAFSLQGTYNEFDLVGGGPVSSFAYGAKTPDRYTITRAARQLIDFRRDPIKVSRPVIFQEIFLFLAPSDAFGTANLTWRWADSKKWDSVWNYSPSTRRVRRLTSANRSDSTLGTEFVQDDANMYNGKIEMFDWKFVGQGTMLIPFWRLQSQAADDYTIKVPQQAEPSSGSFRNVPGAFQIQAKKWQFGFQDDPQRYATWWPTDHVWIPVPALIVEGIPKDPYYNYGRQIFWLETSTFMPIWKQVYNRAGEYWRTAFLNAELQRYEVGGKPFVAYDQSCVVIVDEKTNRGTIAPGSLNDGIIPVPGGYARKQYNAGLDPEVFSLGRFLEFGK